MVAWAAIYFMFGLFFMIVTYEGIEKEHEEDVRIWARFKIFFIWPILLVGAIIDVARSYKDQ